MKLKKLIVAAAVAATSLTPVFAGENLDQARGQVQTYLTILGTQDGKAAVARMMIKEYQKAVQATRESVDQMSERRFQSLLAEFKGTPVGDELISDLPNARQNFKNLLTGEERVVVDTMQKTFESKSVDELKAIISEVDDNLAASAAQNFSVGDVLKKIIGAVAKVVGAGAFIVGAVIRFPIVFGYHFIRTAAKHTVETSGKNWKNDWNAYEGTIFARHVEWVGKKLKKEFESWDDFIERWHRDIPRN